MKVPFCPSIVQWILLTLNYHVVTIEDMVPQNHFLRKLSLRCWKSIKGSGVTWPFDYWWSFAIVFVIASISFCAKSDTSSMPSLMPLLIHWSKIPQHPCAEKEYSHRWVVNGMGEKQVSLLLGQIGDLTTAQFKQLAKTPTQGQRTARRYWADDRKEDDECGRKIPRGLP